MKMKLALLLLIAAFASTGAEKLFTCEFAMKQVAEYFGYTCTVIEITTSDGPNIIRIEGNHRQGRNDNDVIILDVQTHMLTMYNEFFETFINLEAVQLYRTGIQVIDSSDFWDADNLKFLQVIGGNLTVIPRTAFNFARDLEVLRFVSSAVRVLEERALFGLTNLRELSFYDNEIEELRPDTFNSLTNLRNLSMSFNRLERIDGALLANNRRLENVFFQRNSINRIASTFLNNIVLGSFKTLVLQGNVCVNRNFDVSTASDISVIHRGLEACYENDLMTVTPPTTTTTTAMPTTVAQTTTPPATTTVTTTTTVPPETIQLNCTFNFIGSQYACILSNIQLTNENAYYRVGGSHFSGWDNGDVRLLRIVNSEVPFIISQLFDQFTGLTSLELTSSGLERIRGTEFDRAINLRNFKISEGSLRSLEDNSFNALESLVTLFISSEALTKISENAFLGLTQLSELTIHSTIKSIQPNTFSPLVQLTSVIMSDNKVTALDKHIFLHNLRLQTIDFNSNEIMKIEAGFIDHLTELRTLRLGFNLCADARFETNSQFVFDREMIDYELKQCYANVDLLTPIIPEIVQLICTFNWIGSDYGCTMQNVETMNENAIFRVGGSHFSGWTNADVKILRISSSNVPFIVTRFFDLFNGLESLQLWSTRLLRILPTDFDNARGLKSISIMGASSNFRSLAENSFRNLTILERLQLVSGDLQIIHKNAFVGLKNLRDLQLQHNSIEALNVDLLSTLTRLESFTANNNQISRINLQTFANNSFLHTIDLDENRIIDIERGFLDRNQLLGTLRLSSNRCGDASFGSNTQFVFNREMIDYELKQCYANVGSLNPIIPDIVQFNCTFNWIGSDYGCTMQNIRASNPNAIFRVGGSHFSGWTNAEVKILRQTNSDIPFIVPRLFEVFTNLETFQLLSLQLTRILDSDFDNATGLKFIRITGSSSNFRRLENNSFRMLSNLETLQLTEVSLDTIDKNAFAGLSNLADLNLESNSIRFLHNNSLRPLENLQSVSLRDNLLETISDDHFAGNMRLHTINLGDNTIIEIDSNFINQLQNLRTIMLSENRCARANFGPNQMLPFNRELINYELRHCFENVGSRNPTLPDIVPLQCSFNWISSDYACTLQNIQTNNTNATFRVGGSHFSGFTNEDVRTVRIINSDVPFVLSRLFTIFPKMTNFDQSNSMARLRSSDFTNARNLNVLTLTFATVRSLDSGVFQNLINLRALSLRSIGLRTISADNFLGLGNLEEINLSENSIDRLTPDTLQHLTNLKRIVLEGSSMIDIIGPTFANNVKLESINLSFNLIERISASFIDALSQLRELRLAGNSCVNRIFGPSTSPLNKTLIHEELRTCYENINQ